MFFNKMSKSHYYKTSNDLFLHATNSYPYYPTENIEGNPYLSNLSTPFIKENAKKVSFVEDQDQEQRQKEERQREERQREERQRQEQQRHRQEQQRQREQQRQDQSVPVLKMKYETKKYTNSANPNVWGPAFWFSLHNGALRYPIQAAPLWKERMKHFILGIPVMVPCEKCSEHATAYLESKFYKIDEIVTSRSKLFEFFWEFHNYVNRSLNKPEMSLEDAYKMYSGEVELTRLVYNN